MLRGHKVGLRARLEADLPVLHAELYDDVETQSRSDTRAWRPIAPGPSSPLAFTDSSDQEAVFSVVQLADGQLAGVAVLWRIDPHNRSAHIGISMRPAFRGRGLGTDTVGVLCRYGFAVRGLHRLQIETLVDNDAMLRAATTSGFVKEGTLRRSAWLDGDFADEVILGLLVSEWRQV
jgi:RimJ/RimL family protein N-acetyltransferase